MDKKRIYNDQLPKSPEELFHLACTLHQDGQLQEAIVVYTRLLERIPPSPLVFYNTGLAHQELELFDQAISFYHQAVELDPDDGDILFNLALCYQKTGKYEEAVLWYNQGISKADNDPDIYYNIGSCHQQNGQETEAINSYLKALKIDKYHISSLNNLAYLFHKDGQYSNAVSMYERLLAIDPDHQAARHMLTALTDANLSKPSQRYITEVFDNYADNYDTSLVSQLAYDVPNGLRQLYNRHFHTVDLRSKVLDLGCGTGLSGLAFHDISDHLTGVDLSEKMIDAAKKKEIYNRLVVDEIDHFLVNEDERYNLLIAADVLNYIGELETLFIQTFNCTRKGGVFCLSTEMQKTGKEIQIGKTGRFQHSASYLHKTAEQAGWQLIEQEETNLRKEQGNWVKGHLTLLIK